MRRWPGVIHDDHGAYRLRALLLDDGTLEINYYERRTSVTGGRIVQVFEIDPAGYSSASARSYDSIKLLVKKVYIDSSIAGLGITNCNYWFNAFLNCTEVRGLSRSRETVLYGINYRRLHSGVVTLVVAPSMAAR